MLLATMRQMIGIGEAKVNLDEKEWSALLQFEFPLKNVNSGYGHDSNRNYIYFYVALDR